MLLWQIPLLPVLTLTLASPCSLVLVTVLILRVGFQDAIIRVLVFFFLFSRSLLATSCSSCVFSGFLGCVDLLEVVDICFDSESVDNGSGSSSLCHDGALLAIKSRLAGSWLHCAAES